MQGTFTVAGVRVRTQSNRRFVAFRVQRIFDGVRYYGTQSVVIFKRSDNLRTLRKQVEREGFAQSRHFVIVDTSTGEEVTS